VVFSLLYDPFCAAVMIPKLGYKVDPERLTVHTQRRLCQKAFCMITGLGLRTLQTYIALVQRGVAPNAVVGRKRGEGMVKTEMARAWLTHYADLHDSSPYRSHRGVTEVRILDCLALRAASRHVPWADKFASS
jgi:hypothetical protein